MSILKSIFGKRPADSPISAEEVRLVQSSFAKVAPLADQVAVLFYAKLFELDPTLKTLFKNDIKSQGQKLMTMLAAAVNGLSDLDNLQPVVRDLGKRHVGYGVKEDHYSTVGAALLGTLEAGLGEDWTDELKSAWTAVYTWIAVTMKHAAAQAA